MTADSSLLPVCLFTTRFIATRWVFLVVSCRSSSSSSNIHSRNVTPCIDVARSFLLSNVERRQRQRNCHYCSPEEMWWWAPEWPFSLLCFWCWQIEGEIGNECWRGEGEEEEEEEEAPLLLIYYWLQCQFKAESSFFSTSAACWLHLLKFND